MNRMLSSWSREREHDRSVRHGEHAELWVAQVAVARERRLYASTERALASAESERSLAVASYKDLSSECEDIYGEVTSPSP